MLASHHAPTSQRGQAFSRWSAQLSRSPLAPSAQSPLRSARGDRATPHGGESLRSITLGDVTVTRIRETEASFPITALLVAEGGREDWERNSSWLVPDHWDSESNEIHVNVASYLLRSAGKNILIDTGGGNGKE